MLRAARPLRIKKSHRIAGAALVAFLWVCWRAASLGRWSRQEDGANSAMAVNDAQPPSDPPSAALVQTALVERAVHRGLESARQTVRRATARRRLVVIGVTGLLLAFGSCASLLRHPPIDAQLRLATADGFRSIRVAGVHGGSANASVQATGISADSSTPPTTGRLGKLRYELVLPVPQARCAALAMALRGACGQSPGVISATDSFDLLAGEVTYVEVKSLRPRAIEVRRAGGSASLPQSLRIDATRITITAYCYQPGGRFSLSLMKRTPIEVPSGCGPLREDLHLVISFSVAPVVELHGLAGLQVAVSGTRATVAPDNTSVATLRVGTQSRPLSPRLLSLRAAPLSKVKLELEVSKRRASRIGLSGASLASIRPQDGEEIVPTEFERHSVFWAAVLSFLVALLGAAIVDWAIER
jgi:hypothetical protein